MLYAHNLLESMRHFKLHHNILYMPGCSKWCCMVDFFVKNNKAS